MEYIRAIMIEDDPYEVQRFQDYFDEQKDLSLLAVTDSAVTGLTLVDEHKPDAVILDMELREGYGLTFLNRLAGLDLPFRPYVLVTTWTTEPATLHAVRAKKAVVMSKATRGYDEEGPAMVAELLRETCPYIENLAPPGGTRLLREMTDPSRLIHRRVEEAFGQIGINAGPKTAAYLTRAVVAAIQHPACADGSVDMENVIYPILEKEFNTSWKTLEKGMRQKIETTWRTVDINVLRKEYRQYVDPEKGKPELKEFIAYYANRLR